MRVRTVTRITKHTIGLFYSEHGTMRKQWKKKPIRISPTIAIARPVARLIIKRVGRFFFNTTVVHAGFYDFLGLLRVFNTIRTLKFEPE